MKYTDAFPLLKALSEEDRDTTDVPGTTVRILRVPFHSTSRAVLPGAARYHCETDGALFTEPPRAPLDDGLFPAEAGLHVSDYQFDGNSEFHLTLFLPHRGEPARRVMFLMHGLNERYWHKYLPWALRLCEATGSAVLLLPLAFHMNRAPAAWGRPAAMNRVAEERRRRYPLITASSFANAAISSRLHAIPQRLFWSGMQTYDDVLRLAGDIRAGKLPGVAAGAAIDMFAYSIGCFLAEILIMADEERSFERTRLFMFCGGPTFDRMYPVSRYILDSEALIALYAFFVEHLENEFKNDARLAHYFQDHAAGRYFHAMLANRKHKELREGRFRELAGRVAAAALRKDEVIQPSEVLNTLNGDFRDIPIPVHVLDAHFAYSHVIPFPLKPGIGGEVNALFDRVFELAAAHLR
jgi:hypothetical protein